MCSMVPFAKTWSSRISPPARWRTGVARVSLAHTGAAVGGLRMCFLVPFAKTWSSRISPLARWRTGVARVSLATLAVLLLLLPATTPAATNVVVAFTTTNATPLNTGFAGFCTAMQTSAVEYYDTNFQQMAATLSPGLAAVSGRLDGGCLCLDERADADQLVHQFSVLGNQPALAGRETRQRQGRREILRFRGPVPKRGRRENCGDHQRFYRQRGFRRGVCGVRPEQPHSGLGLGAVQRALHACGNRRRDFLPGRDGLCRADEALSRRHQGGGFQRGGGDLFQRCRLCGTEHLGQ